MAQITHTGEKAIATLQGNISIEEERNRILGRERGGLPRLVISADGDFEMKISKDGYDVLTATDDQLIFNSSQNIHKIVYTDVATVPAPGSGTGTYSSVSVNTGIKSTTPLAHTAFIVGSGGIAAPLPSFFLGLDYGIGGILWMHSSYTEIIDGYVHIVLECTNYDVVSGPPAANIRFYIYQEKAS